MAELFEELHRFVVPRLHRRERHLIPAVEGVYVIINQKNGGVEYVGQSIDVRNRILTHQMPWARLLPEYADDFSALVFPVDGETERKALEKKMIMALRPRLNIQWNVTTIL